MSVALWTLSALPLFAAAPQAPSQEHIDAAIERGKTYLLRSQNPAGHWSWRSGGVRSGVTALVTYALLKSGVAGHDPAVLDAVAEFESLPPQRTYDTSIAIMALAAHDAALHLERIQILADALIDWQHGDWGYPGGGDLSNTQYAALGLWSAERAGAEVPRRVWSELAQALRAYRNQDGGFAYSTGSDAATGSMTAAGIGTLAICADRLAGAGLSDPKRKQRLREAIDEGVAWLERRFSVSKNPVSGGWLYYYLYGLERVGGLTGLNFIGEHDWYAEGARELLERQKPDGSWSDGTLAEGEVVSTAFALLFLKRATRPVSPRKEKREGSLNLGLRDAEARVRVLASGDTPLTLWIDSIAEETAAPIEWPGEKGKGPRVRKVVYRTDAGTLAEVRGNASLPMSALPDSRLAARCTFEANGRYRVRADLHVLVPPGYADGLEGKERILRSGVFEVEIRDVKPVWQRQLLSDGLENLVLAAGPRASASSTLRAGKRTNETLHAPGRAVDGRLGTAWLADPDDRMPLLEVEFDQPVRANALVVSHALSRPYQAAHYGRAVEIEVTFNGQERQRLRMPYEETRKGRLKFPAAVFVRRLELRIRLAVPGDVVSSVGLGEVELQLID